jgi:hypothetical protein
MLRYSLACALLVSIQAYATDTYRIGNRVVEVGDSAGKLAEIAGTPLFKEPIESKQGGHEGERWQYRLDGSTVTFVVREGKIISIEQTHD